MNKLFLLPLALIPLTVFAAAKIQDADIKVGAAINAAKLGDGSVSTTEFQYINSLSSNAQTQLGAKFDSANFTDAAVTSKLLTGYSIGAGTVAATDSILQAFNKVNGNVALNVVGPASATDNAIVRFDLTTGKLVQDSGVTVSDGNVVTATGFVGPLTGAVTGNADTSTALAANPTDCGVGTKAISIDASGNLTCSAVALAADVSGNLPVANLNSGTSASGTTFWRGDGTWATPADTGITQLTGDVTAGAGSGSQVATIAAAAVTNAKLADMAASTFKGRNSGGGTGAPEDLTGTQATALLDVFTSALKGLAPASGGGTTNFLRADGTWAAPAGGGGGGSGWRIDGNIAGAQVSLSGADVSAYQEITDSALTMTLGTGSQSAGVEIPCSSTNASTGLTCSAGSEGIGIVFSPPAAGAYDICMEYPHFIETSSVGQVNATFQLVETSNTSQTIIQSGLGKAHLGPRPATAMRYITPVSVCGVFQFADTTERTIRLMYEQDVIATVSSNSLVIDSEPSLGNRDLYFKVRQIP